MENNFQNSMNEGFESSFIKKYWTAKDFQRVIRKICSDKGLDINRIDDTSFSKMDPSVVAKVNDKNLFKFWIWKGQLKVATWSNSLYDEYLETRPSKLSMRSIAITDMPFTTGQGDTPAQWRTFLGTADECWVLNLTKAATLTQIKNQRKEEKKDAIAMLSNREIKALNLKRFAELAKKRRISDGSEVDLIDNINRYMQDYAKKNGNAALGLLLLADTWVGNYALGYTQLLTDYFDKLNQEGWLIPDIKRDEMYKSEDNYQIAKMRGELIQAVDNVKDYMSQPIKDNLKNGINDLMNHGPFWKSVFGTGKTPAGAEEQYERCAAVLRVLDTYIGEILKNKNISENIMNFDMLFIQLNGLRNIMKSEYEYLISIARGWGYTMEKVDKSKIDEFAQELDTYNSRKITTALVKRTEAVLKTVAKI